jgi:hypothetical protein
MLTSCGYLFSAAVDNFYLYFTYTSLSISNKTPEPRTKNPRTRIPKGQSKTGSESEGQRSLIPPYLLTLVLHISYYISHHLAFYVVDNL